MSRKLAEKLFNKNIVPRGRLVIDRKMVNGFIFHLLELIYPHFSKNKIKGIEDLQQCIKKNEILLYELLRNALGHEETAQVSKDFYKKLGEISDLLDMDAKAIFAGDPAAESLDVVISCYPGFLAIFVHRVSNFFHKKNVPIIPRLLSEQAHHMTGVDIHPGAQIGERFCIDHGTGIVIGETTVIGNNVKIYQGVTLGALSVSKKNTGKRRHPKVEDCCTIYSGATILGGNTTIGKNSVIGGNVWLTKSVPSNTVVYHTSEMKYSKNPKGCLNKEGSIP